MKQMSYAFVLTALAASVLASAAPAAPVADEGTGIVAAFNADLLLSRRGRGADDPPGDDHGHHGAGHP